MHSKRALSGLTLVEILLSLVIASMILVFLVPQQLQTTHEQLVDKTVAQMNQLVLAARNYYQAQRPLVGNNASAWPTTLSGLTSQGYLPTAALCSPWPKGPTSVQTNANNNGKDCGNHQEYAIFPANNDGIYDTTVLGIAITGSNSGGSFWGVSIALPSAKDADEVRARTPFATTCPPSELSKTNTACSTTGNIVTAVVPRPASWPGLGTQANYAKDGLIQTIGSVVLCDNTNSSRHCSYKSKSDPGINYTTINKPSSCGLDENGLKLIPQLFVYPISYQWNQAITNSYSILNNNYPGTQLHVVDNDPSNTGTNHTWTVIAGASGNKDLSTSQFNYIALGYFTVCQPNNPITGSWTLPYYPNT